MQARPAPHKRRSTQTRRLLELLDNDAEHRSELDIYQIGKCLQREHHLAL